MNKQLLSYLIIFIFLFSGVNALASNLSDKDTKAMNFIKMDSDYSHQMMDATTNFARKSKLFFDLKNQYLQEGDINLGISFIGLADYQRTNRKSKFSYLMRLPNSGNQVGKEMSEVVVNSVQVQTSGAFTSWGAFYSELLYNPQRNFGAGTISSASRNLTQISQAYVVFGDKDQYPFYASLGKQNVPFGLMDTVNPFTMSMTWHAFAPVAYSAIFGVDTHGLNISAVAVQGGAQFRAANTPVKETNAPSLINNYVGDINYTYSWQEDYSVLVGASYLRGSAYNQGFPVAHFAPGKIKNPAFDVYSKLKIADLTLLGEYAQTVKRWPGTHNPSPPLNIYPASKVTSFTVGGQYTIPELIYEKDIKFSVEYSEFKTGSKGSPWRIQSQTAAGIAIMARSNVKLFSEAIQSKGFVPLGKISGDKDGVPGTTNSDKSSRSMAFIIGIQASL